MTQTAGMALRGLAALGLVAMAAGCTGHGATVAPAAHAAQAGSTPSPSAPSSSPSPRPAVWVSPKGSVSDLQQVPFALVSADGRRVSVTGYGGGCTLDTHLFADESTDRVVLRLYGYSPPPSPGTTCTTELIVMTRSAVLHAPLGRRRLVDASTGRPVHWFDGRRLARVTWLPRAAAAARDALLRKGWVRSYPFPGHRTEAGIDVSQLPGALKPADYTPGRPMEVTRTHVHGLQAVITVQRDDHGGLIQASITWAERGWRLSVASAPEWAWQRPWSPSVLMRVADGLRLPAG